MSSVHVVCAVASSTFFHVLVRLGSIDKDRRHSRKEDYEQQYYVECAAGPVGSFLPFEVDFQTFGARSY
jgi:hypothetical protein